MSKEAIFQWVFVAWTLFVYVVGLWIGEKIGRSRSDLALLRKESHDPAR